MRIGFLKTLLYSRYGDFWLALARDAGAEPVFADPEDVLRHSAGNLAAEVPASGFRLATAEALALAHCDIIVVPGLNYGLESTRGGGQDPWVSDFPEALAATSGLRNIFAVPAWLDPSMTDLVVTFLQQLRSDGWRTRMIMERHRSRLTPRAGGLPPQVRPGTAGVIAQPWIAELRPELLLPEDGERRLGQAVLDPALLQKEGALVQDGLLRSDAEVLGAVRWFSRRGGFSKLTFVTDDGSAPDSWLLRQAERVSHKPVTAVNLSELISETEHLSGLLGAAGEP